MTLTFHCSACQTPYPQAPAPYRCPACAAPLECRSPTPTFPLDQIAARPADIWRFPRSPLLRWATLSHWARSVPLWSPLT